MTANQTRILKIALLHDALSEVKYFESLPIKQPEYSEGYKRIVNLLTGKKDAPLYFDDLEMAVYNDMKDIWPEQHHLVQDARLVYDVLWQLKCEGRLKTTLRPMAGSGHIKERIYMWLED